MTALSFFDTFGITVVVAVFLAVVGALFYFGVWVVSAHRGSGVAAGAITGLGRIHRRRLPRHLRLGDHLGSQLGRSPQRQALPGRTGRRRRRRVPPHVRRSVMTLTFWDCFVIFFIVMVAS